MPHLISRLGKPLAILSSLCAAGLLGPSVAGASTATSSVNGTVQLVGASDFVVQTGGKPRGVMQALVAAANRLSAGNYPYVWGGGHAQAGVPSVGAKGPGHNGRRRGFDCSGSVAAVLASGNLWPVGASVPSDAGVVSELRASHLIAPGAGHGPVAVTLYDQPGVHIFMNIGGRFFGTSAGGSTGNAKGGPGWLDGSTPDAFSRQYRRYHFVPAVLHSRLSGQSIAFHGNALQSLAEQFQVGEPISVAYQASRYGTLVATAISYPGAASLTGTVAAIAPDGSSLTIQPASGSAVAIGSGALSTIVPALAAVGSTVTATYSVTGGTDTLRTLTPSLPPLG